MVVHGLELEKVWTSRGGLANLFVPLLRFSESRFCWFLLPERFPTLPEPSPRALWVDLGFRRVEQRDQW